LCCGGDGEHGGRGGVAMAVLYSSSSRRLRAPFDLGDVGRSRQDCCSVSLDLDLYIVICVYIYVCNSRYIRRRYTYTTVVAVVTGGDRGKADDRGLQRRTTTAPRGPWHNPLLLLYYLTTDAIYILCSYGYNRHSGRAIWPPAVYRVPSRGGRPTNWNFNRKLASRAPHYLARRLIDRSIVGLYNDDDSR